mmetsp:Transcript_31254/g.71530  ORF Transcript_31254/g.71530 Transcript_31254/m.71530 type:complete len:95 (-) Transcript_31254:2135-2419(-)
MLLTIFVSQVPSRYAQSACEVYMYSIFFYKQHALPLPQAIIHKYKIYNTIQFALDSYPDLWIVGGVSSHALAGRLQEALHMHSCPALSDFRSSC